MEKEQARNEEKREERFIHIMWETILLIHPTPVPQPIPQPHQGSDMYHFDLPPFNPEPEDDDY